MFDLQVAGAQAEVVCGYEGQLLCKIACFAELKVECCAGAKGPYGINAGTPCVGHGKVVDGLACHVDGMEFFPGFYANSDAARFPSFTGTQKLGKFDVCASGAGLTQRT